MLQSPRSSSKTCTTCRARKVRCDGHRNVCHNCNRLGLPCSYQPTRAGENDPANNLPRQRVQQACRECRRRKMRCTGNLPSCDRCRRLALECSYPGSNQSALNITPTETAQPAWNASDPPSLAAAQQNSDNAHVLPGGLSSNVVEPLSLPNETAMNGIFENFFLHLYPVTVFSYLHKASLIQRYRSDLRDKALLHALVGITSLLTDVTPTPKNDASRHIDAAETLVLSQFSRPSVAKVQTLVLIIEYRILSQQNEAAFVLLSIAVRYSYALRLNYEAPNMCFLARESRRRLMWSVFLLDMHLASGLPDFTLCPAESIHIQLPCRTENFELDISQNTEPLHTSQPVAPRSIGLDALFIRLSWIRGKIIKSTKRMVLSRSQNVDHIMIEVHALGTELHKFASELPVEYRLTERNLQLRSHTSQMAPYTLLHIWWRQCHCDLYRIVLEGLLEALPSPIIHQLDQSFVLTCQQQCFNKASEIVDIFKVILSLKDKPPFLDFHLPVCAYQCARLLFYIYRTRADLFSLSADTVTSQARQCLNILESFPHRWKGIISIQRDLELLIEHGCSRPPSPTPPTTGESADGAQRHHHTSGPASSQQMFSRHSLVKEIGLVDDSEDLSIPPPSNRVPSSPATARSEPQASHESPSATNFMAMTDIRALEATAVEVPLPEIISSGPILGSDAFDGALDSPPQLADMFSLYSWDWSCEPWLAQYDPQSHTMGHDNISADHWADRV